MPGLHYRVIVKPSGSVALKQFLEHAKEKPGVWFTPHDRHRPVVAGQVPSLVNRRVPLTLFLSTKNKEVENGNATNHGPDVKVGGA